MKSGPGASDRLPLVWMFVNEQIPVLGRQRDTDVASCFLSPWASDSVFQQPLSLAEPFPKTLQQRLSGSDAVWRNQSDSIVTVDKRALKDPLFIPVRVSWQSKLHLR